MKFSRLTLPFIASLAFTGCVTNSVDNTAGRQTVYEDVNTSSSSVQGIGIESQDITAMTDRMVRDMLSNQLLAGQSTPPRIIIDSEYFVNESSSRVSKNLIIDGLFDGLSNAANGRMMFLTRENIGMVVDERQLKRDGVTDGGTIRQTAATGGADYRLTGRITSSDAIDPSTGVTSRFQQINFRMIDLEYGAIVWSGLYKFKKTAQDDVIYR